MNELATSNLFFTKTPSFEKCDIVHKEIAIRLGERLDYIKLNPENILCLEGDLSFSKDFLAKKYSTPIITDLENFQTQSFDLILSNLMLPWCIDLDIFFSEITRILKPNGVFLFSTFGPDTLKELVPDWQLPDMHDIGDKLLKARLCDPVMDSEKLFLEYNNKDKLILDLKNTEVLNFLKNQKIKDFPSYKSP